MYLKTKSNLQACSPHSSLQNLAISIFCFHCFCNSYGLKRYFHKHDFQVLAAHLRYFQWNAHPQCGCSGLWQYLVMPLMGLHLSASNPRQIKALWKILPTKNVLHNLSPVLFQAQDKPQQYCSGLLTFALNTVLDKKIIFFIMDDLPCWRP